MSSRSSSRSADAPPARVAETVRAMDRAERARLRRERRFAEADALRGEIRALGLLVEDTPDGPQLRPLPAGGG